VLAGRFLATAGFGGLYTRRRHEFYRIGNCSLEKQAQIRLEKQIKDGKAENADLDRLHYDRLGVEIDLEALMEGSPNKSSPGRE
jgi:hypothetical protein